MKIVLIILCTIVIVAGAALLPVRPYLDFQVIYHANLGLLRGISLYDHAGQVNMISQLANVPLDRVNLLPFPYPPWYALSTLWLASLPIEVAARLWLAISLMLLFFSLWLLTEGETTLKRAGLMLGGLLWLPVLGTLFVGQYGLPVLLGAALIPIAIRRQSAILVALAAALLTLKPHLGGLLLLLVIILIARRQDSFGRRALLATSTTGAALFGLGFLASPSWPAQYWISLTGFRGFGGTPGCEQCVSLPSAIAKAFGGGLLQAAGLSVALALILGAWLILRWKHVSSTPGHLAAIGATLTLVVSPYLMNYDYLLLLVPFIELERGERRLLARLSLAVAYLLPFVSLATWGTAGNDSLILSACILFALGVLRTEAFAQGTNDEPPLDAVPRPS